MPTEEELEACAKARREGVALWVWNDDYFENILLWMEIWAEAKEEVAILIGSSVARTLDEKENWRAIVTRPLRT